MWEYLIARLMVLLVLCFGTLLIVAFPVIKKHDNAFAWISMVVGSVVILLLLYFLFSSPVIANQILQYGFR